MDKTQVVMEEASGVLDFWFGELSPEQWFSEDPALDKTITSRFTKLRTAALNGELWPWRATPTGRLAELILLDQFSRNMFRGHADAYAADSIALVLAQEAVSVEADKVLTPQQRAFLYMPFMHSESLAIHDVALELFSQEGLEQQFIFEQRHQKVIEQFGRYPHRNAALGRESTQEEIAFLTNNPNGF
ncbi:DUF924 family protein [Alteromonas sp. KUL106]|uniref:DUF924 family protein n=1 Tax=Alteromonas sp. KUL106 TaxID=2480799 RepID=UPI0012E4424F|nr:DUF924 family protein [Alteromonas sp. KUL106]GFD68783.1 membrane protein [Alteromonas sp. KUL106]